MTKPFASALILLGSAALIAACSSSPDSGWSQPNGGGSAGASNTPSAGTGPTAGSTGLPAAGTTGTGTGGLGNIGGSTSTGGAVGQAGSSTGGSTSTGGGTQVNPGEGPPGYLTSKEWHGCSWTGKGEKGATTVTPMDFVAKPPADPFCIAGTVGLEPMYESVALLGFNVNEPAPATCAYKMADATAAGPPAVAPTSEGIAVNFVKRGADTSFTLRVQIQGPNGHKSGPEGAADRWCATLTEVQGKSFVPWNAFTPSCWAAAGAQGTPYAKQPISAVVFSVPGQPTDTPYDFCVNGFAPGSTAADAPDGPAVGGDQKGTVGTNVSPDGDFARAKVTVGGENYIVQNNNWGNPSGTDLILSYTNNSFKITGGSGTGASAPASFPSIYIGSNGNTANGVFSTKTTDNLPIQVSAITSLISTFRYSGTTGSFNAAYDIWFANSPPTAEYKDGIDGFIMIWLRDPGAQTPQPIGEVKASNVMVGNQAWNIWVGPRGDGPEGYNDAPVVSFVNPTPDSDNRAQSFKDVDLKAFFKASEQYGIPATMYLTDVFAGFEIWQGGAGGNLGVDEFTAVVNK